MGERGCRSLVDSRKDEGNHREHVRDEHLSAWSEPELGEDTSAIIDWADSPRPQLGSSTLDALCVLLDQTGGTISVAFVLSSPAL